jgi:hypothetical protein
MSAERRQSLHSSSCNSYFVVVVLPKVLLKDMQSETYVTLYQQVFCHLRLSYVFLRRPPPARTAAVERPQQQKAEGSRGETS